MENKELDIKTMRNQTGLTQAEFGKVLYGIPLRTIQNWEGGKRECPEYVLRLIEFKLREERLIP